MLKPTKTINNLSRAQSARRPKNGDALLARPASVTVKGGGSFVKCSACNQPAVRRSQGKALCLKCYLRDFDERMFRD